MSSPDSLLVWEESQYGEFVRLEAKAPGAGAVMKGYVIAPDSRFTYDSFIDTGHAKLKLAVGVPLGWAKEQCQAHYDQIIEAKISLEETITNANRLYQQVLQRLFTEQGIMELKREWARAALTAEIEARSENRDTTEAWDDEDYWKARP